MEFIFIVSDWEHKLSIILKTFLGQFSQYPSFIKYKNRLIMDMMLKITINTVINMLIIVKFDIKPINIVRKRKDP